MLPKKNRLPHAVTFIKSSSFLTPFFRVLYQENNQSYNRFGFVVSKRIDKRAVVRNRLKRVLRNICQEFTLTQKHTDILFIVRKNFEKESTESIRQTVAKEFENIL